MMKHTSILTKVAIFAIAVSILSACKKDEKTKTASVTSYFSVENGKVVNSSLPAVSGSGITGVITANTKALEGGSSPLTISSSGSASHLLLGVDKTLGYYKVPVSSLESTPTGYVAIILFNNKLPKQEFTIIAELTNDATSAVGSRTEIAVSTVDQSSTAKLQVSLSWDLLNDIDLHLQEPDSNDIYYGNTGYISYDWDKINADHPNDYWDLTTDQLSQYILDNEETTGVLDLDSEAGCDIDSVNNENIIYIFPSDIADGEYIVRVDFFSDCVGSGTTNYIVTARYDGQIIQPTSGSNPYYGTFEAGTYDYGGWGSGIEVMRFKMANAKSAENTQHIYLLKPQQVKAINMEKVRQSIANSR